MTERMDVATYRREMGLEPRPCDVQTVATPTPAERKAAAEASDEAELQAVVVKWLRYALRDDVRFTHVPNGGKRRRVEAARLIGQGVAPGWPDLTFAWSEEMWVLGRSIPQFISRSAFIELKTPTGHLTEKQREFRDWCRDSGIPYAVCRSLDEVVEAVRGWGITSGEVR